VTNISTSITGNSTILKAIAKGLNITVVSIQTNATISQVSLFLTSTNPSESPTSTMIKIPHSNKKHTISHNLLFLLLILLIPCYLLCYRCRRELLYHKNKSSSVLTLAPLKFIAGEALLELAGVERNLFSENQIGTYIYIYI
jgi:hypothetical protein